MTLEKELLDKGFKAQGPFSFSEIPAALESLGVDSEKLEEVLIVRGIKARDDFGEYPNLYMMYTLSRAEKPESYTPISLESHS